MARNWSADESRMGPLHDSQARTAHLALQTAGYEELMLLKSRLFRVLIILRIFAIAFMFIFLQKK